MNISIIPLFRFRVFRVLRLALLSNSSNTPKILHKSCTDRPLAIQ